MSRKYQAIDLLTLHMECDFEKWNRFLRRCFLQHDVHALVEVRYGLMAGMDDLGKQKLNTDEMIQFYLRLLKSVENTAKKVLRAKYPNPHDSHDLKKHWSPEHLAAKRQRDQDFERFMRRSGY